jgi:hypothetical protein
VPVVGHTYLREIILIKKNQSIGYVLKDQSLGKSEKFMLSLSRKRFAFEGINHFTGVEWWNRTSDLPYPIRFQVEISNLLYGIDLGSNSVSYFPYTQLVPNNENMCKQYPISFNEIKIRDGCICYKIDSGTCETGMRFNG